ncbi:hypothetical protein Vi05172_g4640 [Venturia inaequalis]|nr:hypothetical protein Vi05172_g4640 [Venturia inaequalis]
MFEKAVGLLSRGVISRGDEVELNAPDEDDDQNNT